MKKRAHVFVLLLIGAMAASACSRHQRASADTVLIHARIYTVNPKEPWVQAMTLRDPATGEPTGVLKEAAGQLVVKVIPQPTHFGAGNSGIHHGRRFCCEARENRRIDRSGEAGRRDHHLAGFIQDAAESNRKNKSHDNDGRRQCCLSESIMEKRTT